MPTLPSNKVGVEAQPSAPGATRGEPIGVGSPPQPGLPAASGTVLMQPKMVGAMKPRYIKVNAPPFGATGADKPMEREMRKEPKVAKPLDSKEEQEAANLR